MNCEKDAEWYKSFPQMLYLLALSSQSYPIAELQGGLPVIQEWNASSLTPRTGQMNKQEGL